MTKLTFHLNFLGLCVPDFDEAADFYTRVLGIKPAMTHPDMPKWMMLLDGWRNPGKHWEDRKGMMVELFQLKGEPMGAGSINPISAQLLYSNIKGEFSRHSNPLSPLGHAIGRPLFRSRDFQIELLAPGSMRWSARESYKISPMGRLEQPYVGEVYLRCGDLARQRQFFEEVLGMQVLEIGTWEELEADREISAGKEETSMKGGGEQQGTPDHGPVDQADWVEVVLGQGAGRPVLKLREDPRVGRLLMPVGVNPLRVRETWLSVETNDIAEAEVWLAMWGWKVARELTRWPWGGTDIVVLDGDGNPVQVVEYGTHEVEF